MTTEQQRIRALEKQVSHLTEVNDILKKGARDLYQQSKSIRYAFMQQHIQYYRMAALWQRYGSPVWSAERQF